MILCAICIYHENVNYDVISSPHLAYQKANEIVSNYFLEDLNRINITKFKFEEKFQLIHYVYSLLFSNIYTRTNNFEIQKKSNFDFYYATWKINWLCWYKNFKTAATVNSKSSNL